MLGKEACKGLIKANVNPVLKHVPGHGRAKDDSHKKLPKIELSLKDLQMIFPFASLNKIKCAMTAHIKYNRLDNINCALLKSYH